MQVTPIKSPVIRANEMNLVDLLDAVLPDIQEGSVVAITSKIVALCEGSVVPVGDIDKEALVQRQADYFLPSSISEYGYPFTVIQHTLIGSAGIDESNGDGHFVLWPKDSFATARSVRQYLVNAHGLRDVGVIITDSTSMPMRIGTFGICIGFAGFTSINNYIGQPDLFGHPYKVSRANVAGALASAATVVMGEGNERQPIAVLTDMPFVHFDADAPTQQELQEITVDLQTDLFAPFWLSANWQQRES